MLPPKAEEMPTLEAVHAPSVVVSVTNYVGGSPDLVPIDPLHLKTRADERIEFHLSQPLGWVIVAIGVLILWLVFRPVVMALIPVLIGGYAIWAFAVPDGSGGSTFDSISERIPLLRDLPFRQRRAGMVILGGLIIWGALALIDTSATSSVSGQLA